MAFLEEKLWLLLPTLALAVLLGGWVRGQAVIRNTDHWPHELEVLYDPESSTASDAGDGSGKGRGAIVDFVAVHGLGSWAEWAWVHKTTRRNWLSEFLPRDLDHRARIMTYNHGSHWKSNSLRKTFDAFALDLLRALERKRCSPEERERPIIFVGHSFGGLLVKKALIEAGEVGSAHRNIADSTTAIIFLGVPHQGSNVVLHRIGLYVALLYKLFGSRTDLLDLVKGSNDLYKLDCQFRKTYGWINCICFYECVPEYIVGIDIGTVVSERSATIYNPQTICIGLNTDHRGMNKFESKDDKNYLKVLHEVKRLVDDAPNALKREPFRKRYWHRMVPYSQNSDFTGRKDLIAELVKLLASPKTGHHRVALSGLGGTGKTQIALKYTYRQVDYECHIFWVYGKSHETFSRDYQEISTRLKLPRISDKEDEILLGVKHWFESNESGKWFLVLDNADNPSEFVGNQGGISRYLPQGLKGTLIVTTRSNTVASRLGCKMINVTKMKPEEATDLFRQLYSGSIETMDTNSIHELLLALDYLPLAIAAATAYMRETGTLLVEYLDILNSTKANQVGLLMKKFYDIRRELQEDEIESADDEDDMTDSVLSTYYITFRRIQELCPLAANILKLTAFLDQQAIPEQFLTESGLDGATNLLSFRTAVGYLFDFSLISRGTNPKTYGIHRLVHLSMETYVLQNPDKAINWKRRALDIVSRLFPPGEYKNWVICAAYLPHVLTVLRHADESESNSVKLFGRLGIYMYSRGQYRAAEDSLKHALNGYEKTLGNDHPSTLDTVNNIAIVFKEQGEYIKALELYQRALDGYEKTLGNDHPSTLNTVNNIAIVFNEQGEHIKALELYQRALDGKEKTLGNDHPSTLDTVNNMATVFNEQGEHIKALEWYQRALDGKEKTLGNDHPSTLDTVNNMAMVFKEQGEYTKALEWYQRALDGKEKALGNDHPSTLSTINNIATVFYEQGEYIKALEWYQRALDGTEKTLG